MTPALKKRFWTSVDVVPVENGFAVELDGRRLKTPSKAELTVPNAELAALVAAEWDAVDQELDPTSMPATRWANSVIDKVSVQHAEIVDMLAEYGGSDLLCYRADSPEALALRQAETWDPILEWAKNTHDAPLATTRGMMPIAQSNHSLGKFKANLSALDEHELASVHDLVTISGSLVLALAVLHGEISAETAWNHSRIDEDWQAALWGEDEEAVEAAAARKESFLFAEKLLQLLRRQ